MTNRDGFCYCYSGKKYAVCHGIQNSHSPQNFALNTAFLSLEERNVLLVQSVLDIFGAQRQVSWRDVKRNISGDQVKQLYKVIADLWPLDTDVESLLPKSRDKLIGVYSGDVNPVDIVQNILRFGLYTDEIMIIDPFHSPHYWRGSANPIETPDIYKADTLKLVYFIYVLEPWIKAGLVKIIPNPGSFDKKIFDEFVAMAAKRIKETNIDKEIAIYAEEMMGAKSEETRRIFLSQPNNILEKHIREANPNYNDKEVEKILQGFINERINDPVMLEQPPLNNMIYGYRGGANLETLLFISHLTGSFPFTALPWKWKEILSQQKDLNEDAKIWSPLTKAFQELEFKFLNSVDHKFAVEMRQDGRLENFRTFLRKVWNSTNKGSTENSLDYAVRDYKDELIAEYHKAESEWDRITRDLTQWAGSTGLVSTASAIGAILTGNMLLSIPATISSMSGLWKIVTSRMEKKEFRKKFPMAVFVDLNNRNKKVAL